MNVKRLVKKMSALVAGATMVGATVMGAMAYDLGNYPSPFVKDGMGDFVIVVGENAKTADVIGATDIAASLQAAATVKEPVDIPGLAGEVSLSGTNYKLETPSDKLEIREAVGDVVDTLTEDELPSLKSGRISTSEGDTDYNQYIRFGSDNGLTDFGVNYIQHEDTNVVDDYLVVPESGPFFEWEIEFTQGLESSVDSDGRLQDMEDKTFNIFGTDYSIVTATLDGSHKAADTLDLLLMGGSVASQLNEGETKTFTINGVDYVVTLVFVSDPSSGSGNNQEARFQINGEMTETLNEGDTTTLSDGVQIGVRDILVNPRAGAVSFFLGADKVEFEDSNTTDGQFDGRVEINNQNIDDAKVRILGADTGTDKYEITDIKYQLTVDSSSGDVYVPKGHGIKEYLRYPESFLSPTFDIQYQGLSETTDSDIKLKASADEKYDLTFTNIRGKEYKVPFISNEDGNFKFGEDNNDFIFVEASNFSDASTFNIGDNDYFLLTDDNGDKSVSTILRYDDLDTTDNTLYFTYQTADGSKDQKTITFGTFTNGIATADLVVEGTTYKVYVNESNNNLAIDMNADGNAGDLIPIYIKGGARLDLINGAYNINDDGNLNIPDNNTIIGDGQVITPADFTGNSTTITGIGFKMRLFQEADNFDSTTSTPGELTWKIHQVLSDNEMDLGDVSYTGPLSNSANKYSKWSADDKDDDHNDDTVSMTDFGGLVYEDSSSDANDLTITYPDVQKTAQVFVVNGDVEVTVGTAGVTSEKVNPVGVGLAVLDVNAPAVGSENMIVVGGPCANTVAAELLGNPAVCTEGFEPGKAMIKSFDEGDKVALLVAGYSADDTVAATRVLADYEANSASLAGLSEAEVITANSADIQIRAPSVAEEPAADSTATTDDTTTTE